MFGWLTGKKSQKQLAKEAERAEIADIQKRMERILAGDDDIQSDIVRSPEQLHQQAMEAQRERGQNAPPMKVASSADFGLDQQPSSIAADASTEKAAGPSAQEKLEKAIGSFAEYSAFAMTVGAPDFPLGVVQRDLDELSEEEALRIKVARIFFYFDLMDLEQYLVMSWAAIWGDGKGAVHPINTDDLAGFPKLTTHFEDDPNRYAGSLEKMLDEFYTQAQSLIEEGISSDLSQAYAGVSEASYSSKFEAIPFDGQAIVFSWLEALDHLADKPGVRGRAYDDYKRVITSAGLDYDFNDAERSAGTADGAYQHLINHQGDLAIFGPDGCTGYVMPAGQVARKLAEQFRDFRRPDTTPLEEISEFFGDPRNTLRLGLGENNRHGHLARSLASLDHQDLAIIKLCNIMTTIGVWSTPFANNFIYPIAWGGGRGSVEPLSIGELQDIDPSFARMTKQIYEQTHHAPAQGPEFDRYVSEIGRRAAQELLAEELIQPEEARNTFQAALGDFMGSNRYRDLPETFRQVLEREIYQGSRWFIPSDLPGSLYEDRGEDSVLLGKLDEATPLHFSGEGALLTIAPPGAGKTQAQVLPNLLKYPGAAIVLDVKGECYDHTAAWREEHVGPVLRYAPQDPGNSAGFNPLDFVRADPDFLVRDARDLADLLIPADSSSEPFWRSSALDLLAANIVYIVARGDENASTISDLLDMLSGSRERQEQLRAFCADHPARSVRRLGENVIAIPEKTLGNVYVQARTALGAWEGGDIERLSEHSDWDVADFCDPAFKGTLYICVDPSSIDVLMSVLRVIIGLHVNTMITHSKRGREDLPVLFMVDELPQLGNMPPILKGIEVGRSKGVRMWGFCQTLDQIRERYGDPYRFNSVVKTVCYMNPEAGLAKRLADDLGWREGLLDGQRRRLAEPTDLAGPEWANSILVTSSGQLPAKAPKWPLYAHDHPLHERATWPEN